MTTEELIRLHNKLDSLNPTEIGLRAGPAAKLLRELIDFRQRPPNRMTAEQTLEFNRRHYGQEDAR